MARRRRSGGAWAPYVTKSQRMRSADAEVERQALKGKALSPVRVEGRAIAHTFWGKAWCDNLERYSDFANRLPRGRTYVRSGAVIDLQVKPGRVEAKVRGTRTYTVSIGVTAVPKDTWAQLSADCAGEIDSLVALLQGKLSKAVMERLCREGTGLFPSPAEITLACTCPDWATMCKHVAATLYGVGARLDERPEHLFTLRGVSEDDLLRHAGAPQLGAAELPGAQSARVLRGEDLSALFGLELTVFEDSHPAVTAPARPLAPSGRARRR